MHKYTHRTRRALAAYGLETCRRALMMNEHDGEGAFIVKACNAHDELVARLRDCVQAMADANAHMLAEIPEGGCVPPALTELEMAEMSARAALAKVQP